jgi:hypothetical protein
MAGRPTAAAGAGGADDAPPDAGGGDSGGAGSDVVVEIIDVPGAESCTPTAAMPQVFMPPEEWGLVFDRAGVVGPRRYAFDSVSLALITFGEAGADPSAISFAALAAVAPFGDDLATLELGDDRELVARSYDGFLEQRDDELLLDTEATGAHALGASAQNVLAVWGSGGELHGRALVPAAALGDSFDFGPRSCGEHSCVPQVSWTGERFVVLWSRVEASGESVLSWAALTEQGAIIATRNVFSAEDHYGLAGVTQLADGRLAVLLTLGAPALAPILLFVDEHGVPEPKLQRLKGATEAWSVASIGNEVTIVARSNQSQAVLRRFDDEGKVAGDWICLDDSGIDTAFEPRAALFSEGAALGAVVRLTDGSAAYLSGVE